MPPRRSASRWPASSTQCSRLATSEIQPLPHQIRAVYGRLLDGRPLRYLLADDPGAGKTIEAGLYIKELLLRDDVKRCLIVTPGGLVEQWQDEVYFKFGLSFRILTTQLVDTHVTQSPFDDYPLLIARMDQLARSEDLLAKLAETEWDLVVVDEAHRMAAHAFPARSRRRAASSSASSSANARVTSCS